MDYEYELHGAFKETQTLRSRLGEADILSTLQKSAYADDDRTIPLDYEYELWFMRGMIFD